MSKREPTKTKKEKAELVASEALPSPVSMLRIAEAYMLAAEKTEGAATENSDLITVSIVNDAFALELLFKALYVASERKLWPKNIHNLAALYKELQPHLRKMIAEMWAQILENDRPAWIETHMRSGGMTQEQAEIANPHVTAADFEREINRGANMFVDWRYPFQGKLKKEIATLGPAAHAIRALIRGHLTPEEKSKYAEPRVKKKGPPDWNLLLRDPNAKKE